MPGVLLAVALGSPLLLLQTALVEMAAAEARPDFILVTGDSVAHNLSTNLTLFALAKVRRRLRASLRRQATPPEGPSLHGLRDMCPGLLSTMSQQLPTGVPASPPKLSLTSAGLVTLLSLQVDQGISEAFNSEFTKRLHVLGERELAV